MFHLAFLNKVLHRTRHVLNRNIEIDAVLVVEIDGLHFETLERFFRHPLDVFGPTVQSTPSAAVLRIRLPTKFGRDHHAVAIWEECFTDQLFVQKWAIHLSSVEKCNASFHSSIEQRDHLLPVFGWAV